jgi:hypothetical protein
LQGSDSFAIKILILHKRNPAKAIAFVGFLYQMVAGSGFEPLTFGL